MTTIIFDFDSTLLNCESLEELLKGSLNESDSKLDKLYTLTNQGMNGEISFEESLQKRLALAQPNKSALEAFIQKGDLYWTSGMKELLTSLSKKYAVWILTGGFEFLVEQMCKGIPLQGIRGVKGDWDSTGKFISIDTKDPFSKSKIIGAKTLVSKWNSPVIMIGDGMTDYALFEEGVADYFIAYIEHVKRAHLLKIVEPTTQVARNVPELKKLLQWILSF
jgi:phosphoserine phosphatase